LPPKTKHAQFYWTTYWIVLQQPISSWEAICLPPDETINPDSYTKNSPFIAWIHNRPYIPTPSPPPTPIITSVSSPSLIATRLSDSQEQHLNAVYSEYLENISV